MAYGKKYELKFTNRIQGDVYRVELWEKDFAGDVVQLKGATTPFVLEYQDQELLEPIQAASFTISFLNDGLSIEDFYSDDDEAYRMDFYFETDGIWPETLLNTGYLVQDGASEPVTDRQHYITLKATDNVALLKNVKWNETSADYIGQHTLGTYVKECLQETGLYSHNSLIDMSLPLRVFSNLFENTTDDRSDSNVNDPFEETVLDSNIFKNDDSTWIDCYEVLSTILTGMNAVLVQAEGYWNVIRRGEYKLFDGVIPGTKYVYNGSGTTITPFGLLPPLTIDRGALFYPVAEDQVKTIQRPLRQVRNTFNYNSPEFINQSDLQLPAGASPYDTDTVGDLRFDRYSLATYFPTWVQRDSDASYLEVVTDISTDPQQEKERYIVTPSANDVARGVQFNPIPVSQGDKIDFSLQYRTFTDTNNYLNFGVRFTIITAGSTSYTLVDFPPILTAPDPGLLWTDIDSDDWDNASGVHLNISDSAADDIDTTEYQPYSLSGILAAGNRVIPVVPVDGILLVQVMGTNTYSASENTTTLWKDIRLDIKNFTNESTLITGQVHTDTGTSTIKATQEKDVLIDDSPRNSIAGTLFTDAISTFEHTDVTTGEATGIGNIYFTKTFSWHRGTINEALRLGNILTQEILEFKSTSRIMIEGSFRNLRDGEIFISILNLFQIGWLPDRGFLFSGLTIDYMNCVFNGRLVEIYKPEDIISVSVYVSGTKDEELAITSGIIHFDSITYYGGAASYIAVSDTNSKFTYTNGFDTTIQLSVIFYVPISGSGTATFTILKNGSTIATQTVAAIEHFKRIDFDLTESVTDTDYFQANVSTGGAAVDIQSGSINITVNDVAAIDTFPYSFNYIYKTDN